MRKTVTTLFMSLDGVVEADADWQFAYFDDEWFGELAAGWNGAVQVVFPLDAELVAALRSRA